MTHYNDILYTSDDQVFIGSKAKAMVRQAPAFPLRSLHLHVTILQGFLLLPLAAMRTCAS